MGGTSLMRVRYVIAVVTAVTLSVALAFGADAGAATLPCGPGAPGVDTGCAPFTQEFGPSFVLDVLRGHARTGQPIILFRASAHDAAEDFSYSLQGTVDDFYHRDLISPAMMLHYSALPAFELEYTPYGRGTDLCVGVATAARRSAPVSLQPCGASARTVWVLDFFDAKNLPAVSGFPGPPVGYVPVINGSDANFSHPYVATYPAGGSAPQDRPRPQVVIANLIEFSEGTVYDNQMWGIPQAGAAPGPAATAPAPAATAAPAPAATAASGPPAAAAPGPTTLSEPGPPAFS